MARRAGVARDLFEPVLARLRSEAAMHFGGEGVRLDPLRYEDRPFSHLLRVGVSGPGAEAPRAHVFVKIFKPRPDLDEANLRRRVEQDFDTTQQIHRCMSSSVDVGAVRPIACYPEYFASVTEESRGSNLLDHLETRAAWLPNRGELENLEARMAAVGRWVREFQGMDARTGEVSLTGLRDYIDVRLQRLVRHSSGSFDETDRHRVLRHVEALGVQVPQQDLCESQIHADLAPANVLICGERIVVLDFAMATRGSIFHDLSRFHLQLDLMCLKPQFGRRVIQRLQSALLRGYHPALPAERPMFRLLLMLHHVNHLTTLTLKPERFPASLYSRRVRRAHRKWLAAEIARAECRSL